MEKVLGMASVVPVNGEKPRSYRITLIEDVAKKLQIKKGDKVLFMLDEGTGRIYIKKA